MAAHVIRRKKHAAEVENVQARAKVQNLRHKRHKKAGVLFGSSSRDLVQALRESEREERESER